MIYLESKNTDPRFNLALEQYAFDSLDQAESYFMLWQNHNAIIVGKHQNTVEEINSAYVKEQDIRVVRRLSGGGAVYHDLGNLNFTFITDAGEGQGFDFAAFCRPVVAALESLGVKAEISGRNDMTIDGKKFSGNAQYVKRGRVMHHGTLMYDSDLSVLTQALNVPPDKIASKGLKSVRSRVTNIKPYMRDDLPVSAFWEALRDYMFQENGMRWHHLAEEELAAVEKLKEQVYDQWDWNYGASPAYDLRKERRIEGFGSLQIHMNVEKGSITAIAFYGDYFGDGDTRELADRLIGTKPEERSLREALIGVDIGRYFSGVGLAELISVILQ